MTIDPREIARHFLKTLEDSTDDKLSEQFKRELLLRTEQLVIDVLVDGMPESERKVS